MLSQTTLLDHAHVESDVGEPVEVAEPDGETQAGQEKVALVPPGLPLLAARWWTVGASSHIFWGKCKRRIQLIRCPQ